MRIRPRPFAIAVLCLTALLAAPGCASKDQKKDDALLYLKIGTAFFSNKKYPEALREFERAERLDPKNPTVQNNLALTYFVRERYDLALMHIDRAIELDPKYTEARNNRSRILIEQSRFDEAAAEAKKATEDLTYPMPVRAWSNIALAYFRKGDFNQAKASATAALKVDRENCFAQTILGRSLLELNQLNDAAITLDRASIACRAEGDDEAGYFSGLAHYKLGKKSAAVARLQAIIKDFPQGLYTKKAESLLEIIR